MKRAGRLPDFAGVALVDILANGLAMLIIVIVLSIAARTEHEERTSAQVEEVETMMSRRFSTSLVLNSLAASPPAQLHDYRASALDQERDPYLLPIIELHRGFVRELYTGAVWSREELLREPNAMDAWLDGFDEDRKRRLRTDVYDVAQFYLAMSILRDHGVTVRHWHFLTGGLGIGQGGHCPPGVAAGDCKAGAGGEGPSTLPALASGAEGNGAGDGAGWPPPGFPGESNGRGGAQGEAGPFPGGAALGDIGDALRGLGGGGGLLNGIPGLGAGSFPNARPGLDGRRGLLGAARGLGQGQGGETRFRLSSPESLRPNQGQPLDWGEIAPTTEQILAVLLDFIGRLQGTLDAGASPSAQLENFEQLIAFALAAPPTPDDLTRGLIRALMVELRRPFPEAGAQGGQGPQGLKVIPLELETRANTALIVQTNRRLRSVSVGRAQHGAAPETTLPDAARPVLRLHAHPDIWRGLSLPLEPNAILLMPPLQQHPERLRWRAVAYVAPEFNDFIIGFAYAAVDAGGRLVVRAEDNRVRLDGRPLHTPYREALFGARSWLVALYAGLVLGLLGLLLLVRRLGVARHA